jgi:hypothetical protein
VAERTTAARSGGTKGQRLANSDSSGTAVPRARYRLMERPIEKTPTEARQAVKVWPMKYVLAIGTGGAILALLVAWLIIGR